MVINFCGFRRRVRPNGSSEKAASENEENNGLMNKLMAAMKSRKRPEKKQERQLCIDNCEIKTLEELIVSSPSLNAMNVSGGETPMQKQSSRKIHPSFDGDLKLKQLNLPKSTTNQPKNCQLSNSAKSKKVSFRSPEVADFFVLHHSPEMDK